MIRNNVKVSCDDNMNQNISKLYETIYKSTCKPPNVSESSMVALIAPLVRAAYESKTEPNTEHLEQVIQCEGEKFIEMLKNDQIEYEMDFFKFQRRFAIRSILHNYYECEQTDMTFIKLYNYLKPQWTSRNLTTDWLKSWLRRLGFSIITVPPNNREKVIEMHSQKLARLKYIRRIQSFRQAQRNIVYFREVTICLSKKTAKQSTDQELTVFFAANQNGLLNFAFVEKDARTTENFVEWLTIISENQPKNSVLVIEPKPFSVLPKPTLFSGNALPSSFKFERIWKNYNTFIPGMHSENAEIIYSSEMLDFCWRYRDSVMVIKKSSIDPTKEMQDIGHEVIYLPCLHHELSPTHRIDFVELIDQINESNRNIEKIKNLIRSRLDSSTTDEWKRYSEDAIRAENDFLKFEALLSEGDEAIEMDDSSDGDVQILDENREIVTLDDED